MTTCLFRYLSIVLLALVTSTASALSLIGGDQEQELLPAEEAFQTSVSVNDAGQLAVHMDIAEGYFVYKSKIKVNSDVASIGPLDIPDGVRKQDKWFGEVETFRNTLKFSATVTNNSDSNTLPVTVVSQGCADIGICYPPLSQDFTIEVPASSNTATVIAQLNPLTPHIATSEPMSDPALNAGNQGSTLKPLNSLGLGGQSSSQSGSQSDSQGDVMQSSPILSSVLNTESESAFDSMRLESDGDEVLDPELAFTVIPGQAENGSLPITWTIAEGHYLYDPKFKFEVIQPTDVSIANTELSEGKLKNDEFFGEVEVHRGNANALLNFNNASALTNVTLKVGYQGCADIGICYPPQYKEFTIAEIPAAVMASVAPADSGGSQLNADNPNGVIKTGLSNTADSLPMAEQDRLAASLGSGKTLTTILTFFGLGLLLTFTPCVLPMIPILSSIIVGNGTQIGTAKAFTLSLIYVLAMALTYTVAGVIIGLTGENIQATLQHPYVLGAFALLFVVLSASMFGLYELQMPAFIQNRLTNVSNNQKSGSVAGVATMGFLSALIVGPCVTAPLVGALIYIGQTGDAVLGGAALFALSMGMGLPLLIIGTSFGKYLPTAGPWMDKIKAVFGVMLLGLAIWMLDRVVPGWVIMALFSLLLISVGVFLGVFEGKTDNGWQRLGKGFGYASLVYGTLLMIGVTTGSGTLFKPLQGLAMGGGQSTGTAASQHVAFRQVKGEQELEAALTLAKAQNKPVILDFYADWCVSCKEMEAFTFTDERVAKQMSQAVLLQADVTANDKKDKALLRRFGIFGPPAIIFYDPEGTEIDGARVVGYMPAEKFSYHLDRVL